MKKENVFNVLGVIALIVIILMCIDLSDTFTTLNEAKNILATLTDPFASQMQAKSILLLEKTVKSQIIGMVIPGISMITSFMLSTSK